MIPTVDVQPHIPDPLPAARMPRSDEISEEGFGGFWNTWFLFVDAKVANVRHLGRVPVGARSRIVHESGGREIIGLDVSEAGTEAFWRAPARDRSGGILGMSRTRSAAGGFELGLA